MIQLTTGWIIYLIFVLMFYAFVMVSTVIEGYSPGMRRIFLHHTNWCPHCRTMMPVWKAVSKSASNVIFIEVDEDIAKTPGVEGYPTIIMLDEHGKRHKYHGGPDYTTLRNWAMSPLHLLGD
jgi:thiol-disulfide isomerase/thioredoxin